MDIRDILKAIAGLTFLLAVIGFLVGVCWAIIVAEGLGLQAKIVFISIIFIIVGLFSLAATE